MSYPDPTVFGHDPWWLILVKAVAIFVFLLLTVLVAILLERKVLGRMQMRYGPNRVGPFGVLQSLADGIKLALKEGLVPAGVDRPIYLMAPVISVTTAILGFAVMPMGPVVSVFGHHTPLQLTDLPVGVLYVLAITSIGVYGIVLAGWASGSTYPLLGGLRSSAQVVSYELILGLSLAGIFLLAGSLSLREIVLEQQQNLSIGPLEIKNWYIFSQPLAFVIFLIAAVAETNRAPFDLPEAETELISGFHTEYSAFRFSFYFLGEYIAMIVISLFASTLFLGGPSGPGSESHWWLGIIYLFFKTIIFLFFYVWLRATLPRFRYDQLMGIAWKVLFPLVLLNLVVTAAIRLASDGKLF